MQAERRRTARHQIDFEIRVNDGTAVARNLSTDGVYFETDDVLVPDQEVSLVFPFEHAAPSGTRARCVARVLRVEQRGPRYGVAAAYQTIAFESLERRSAGGADHLTSSCSPG